MGLACWERGVEDTFAFLRRRAGLDAPRPHHGPHMCARCGGQFDTNDLLPYLCPKCAGLDKQEPEFSTGFDLTDGVLTYVIQRNLPNGVAVIVANGTVRLDKPAPPCPKCGAPHAPGDPCPPQWGPPAPDGPRVWRCPDTQCGEDRHDGKCWATTRAAAYREAGGCPLCGKDLIPGRFVPDEEEAK